MKNKLKLILVSTSIVLPIVSSAQYLTNTTGIAESFYNLLTKTLIPIAFTLALLYFFWGVAKYIRSDAGSGKEEGRQIMVWGVVALFVMSSVWGIIFFLSAEIGLTQYNVGTGGSMQIPTITK